MSSLQCERLFNPVNFVVHWVTETGMLFNLVVNWAWALKHVKLLEQLHTEVEKYSHFEKKLKVTVPVIF